MRTIYSIIYNVPNVRQFDGDAMRWTCRRRGPIVALQMLRLAENAMDDPVKRIAVVQGAPSDEVRGLFQRLVDRWRPSTRLAGVMAEDHGLPGRACSAGYLRSLASGERFAIFQDLGAGSRACHLDGAGVLTAAAAVQRDIAAGCDLVLLSKFGKLEADGAGLRDAFTAAIDAGVPVLTSVSPAFEEAWRRFAAPLFAALPADADRLEAWWTASQLPRPSAVGGQSLSARL
jgi:hypothetical protein